MKFLRKRHSKMRSVRNVAGFDRVYLTTGVMTEGKSKGRLLAIMSIGGPQVGDENVTVLTMEVVDTVAEAVAWFERMKIERPWEPPQ